MIICVIEAVQSILFRRYTYALLVDAYTSDKSVEVRASDNSFDIKGICTTNKSSMSITAKSSYLTLSYAVRRWSRPRSPHATMSAYPKMKR